MPGSGKYEGLLWKGLGLAGKKYDIVICCPWQAILQENDVPLVLTARNSFPLCRKPSETRATAISPLRGQPEPFSAVQAPAEQKLFHFQLCLPLSRTWGYRNRISCFSLVGSQDEAVREAFKRIIFESWSRSLKQVGHSRTELVFLLLLMSSAYCSRGLCLRLQTALQSDGRARQWMKGLREYLTENSSNQRI